ncbi:MAG: hypothetical protein Tsb0014_21750 [Pleurocapsa sp.]
MSTESFKQDSLGWRIELLKQRFREWIEFKFSQVDGDNWDFSWLRSPLLWQITRVLLWSIIAILLVWIVWQLWLWLRPYFRRWRRQKNIPVESRPVPIPQLSVTEWIGRSQEYAQQRDYRQAIFCLYQGMLQILNDRGILTNLSSRTDGEYKRSLQQLQLSSFAAYELLLSIHQRLCFSNAEASQLMFEQCQEAYQEIARK